MKDKIEIELVELKPLTRADMIEGNIISNIVDDTIKKKKPKKWIVN